jgi:hypothetical protein
MLLVIRFIEPVSKGELELAEANVQKCKVRHLGMVENE